MTSQHKDDDEDESSRTPKEVLDLTSADISDDPDVGGPPDGGWRAWLCVLCGHFIYMNTWGVINSFGIFQTYYTSHFGRSPSDIAWVGSIQTFLSFFVGAFIGRFVDAGHLRLILATGMALILVGIFTASAAHAYWQLVLAQGLCIGLGNGFLVTPGVSVVSTYFERRRSLAIGIATCGSVTGGLIFPAIARQLIPSVGLGWALRAIGFVQLATLAFVTAFMKSRVVSTRSSRLVHWVAFKEWDYTLFTAGMFFNFWAVFFGFYYIGSFSRTAITPQLPYSDSLNLLLILNGVGVIGRILPNHFADTVGPLNMLLPACLVSGIAIFAWIAVTTPAQLYGWAIVYGIVGGSILSLFPAGISSLSQDMSTRSARMGMSFTVISFAALTGNPIAGVLITAEGGRYVWAQVFMGASFMVGTALIASARIAKQRRLRRGWVAKI